MAKFESWCSPVAKTAENFPLGLRELPFTHQVNLRGDRDDPEFCAAIKENFGLELPKTPNRVGFGTSAAKALWLSPSEWLIVSDSEIAGIRDALTSLHAAATDVSANRIIFELSGPNAGDVLMKSCEMDLHPRVFKSGHVVQTLIAKSQAIIEKVTDDNYHIYVRNSFAVYVSEWLVDAHTEYRM